MYLRTLLDQGPTKGSAGYAGAVIGKIAAVYVVAALSQVELVVGLACQARLRVAPSNFFALQSLCSCTSNLPSVCRPPRQSQGILQLPAVVSLWLT